MPSHGLAAEARLEALQERFGQGDFGEQNQRLLSLTEALGNRFEIDLGLARARNAVEQNGIEALAYSRSEARGGLFLVIVELGWRKVRIGTGEWPVGIDRDGFQRAGVDQSPQHSIAYAGVVGELADRA